MSSPLKKVLDVLALRGEIEYARCVGGNDPPPRPPVLSWRYKVPEERLEKRIQAAVQSYAGAVDWLCSTNGKNWAIIPVAFAAYQKNFLGLDVDAMQQYGQEFPVETKAACDDAARLAEHMENELAREDASAAVKP